MLRPLYLAIPVPLQIQSRSPLHIVQKPRPINPSRPGFSLDARKEENGRSVAQRAREHREIGTPCHSSRAGTCCCASFEAKKLSSTSQCSRRHTVECTEALQGSGSVLCTGVRPCRSLCVFGQQGTILKVTAGVCGRMDCNNHARCQGMEP